MGPVSPLRLHSDPWVSDGVTLLHYTNFVFSAGNPVVDAETCCLCCSSSLDFSLGVGEICMSVSPSGVVPRSQSLSLSGVAGSLSCVPVPVSPPPCLVSLSLRSVPSSLSCVFPPPCAVSLSLSSVAGSLSCVPVFQAPCRVSLSLSRAPGSLSHVSVPCLYFSVLFCFALCLHLCPWPSCDPLGSWRRFFCGVCLTGNQCPSASRRRRSHTSLRPLFVCLWALSRPLSAGL